MAGETDMRNLIEYKGYVGSVEFSPEGELFYGKVKQGLPAIGQPPLKILEKNDF